MDQKDLMTLCEERFEKWTELLASNGMLPVCIIGLSLDNPLTPMKVFALAHTDRTALSIFLKEAALSVIGDNSFFIVDGED